MTRSERWRVNGELRELNNIRNHLGVCSTAGKTKDEIAQLDEQFFLACEKREVLLASVNLHQKGVLSYGSSV